MTTTRLLSLLPIVAAIFLPKICAGGANFQNRVGSNLVCLYLFTDGQTSSNVTTVADWSNSTFSPGSLQFGSTASWIPDSIGVRLAARAPGETPGTGLTSTRTLANWTLHMRALQSPQQMGNSTFAVELWLRPNNTAQSLARALVGFRDWSSTFATRGQEFQSFGMKLEDSVFLNWYITETNSSARLDMAGGSYNIGLRNASSLVMLTLSYCKRVSTNVNFGDCFVNDSYIATVPMAYCLTIRSNGVNFTSCKTSASTATIRFLNNLDFRAWSLSNMLQFAPFYSSNASTQPHSWAGDIFLAAVYAQSLNASEQAQNYAAGLPNSQPYVAATAEMSAFEDTMNASTLFALTGYDFDGDTLHFDIMQLPSVGSLYNYNGTHFVEMTSVPYRITSAPALVGYLQAPVLTFGRNFSSFAYNAWDGQLSSRSNCTVTINVFNVNHVPHSFPSQQSVNAEVPTSLTSFTCTDPDAPAGDYISQFCIASAPSSGTFTANVTSVTSFPFCFSSNYTAFQLLYTSEAIRANAINATEVFAFYCTDTFGTQSNASNYTLILQSGVWAVAGISTGPENGNLTVVLLGTSNITSNIQYQIVALPTAGTLYNGNLSVITSVPTAVVGGAANTVYYVPPNNTAGANFSLMFTASVTNGTSVTVSAPARQQLNVTPIDYDFSVNYPINASGFQSVPTPITVSITSLVTPGSLFFVQIQVDMSTLEQVSLNFTSGGNVSRFDSSGALGTYTCLSDFRGCAFWGTQDAVNLLLNGMTVSRFTLGSDNVTFVITSCLFSYCQSGNYSKQFDVLFTWSAPPPTEASSLGLSLILIIIVIVVTCCCCCFVVRRHVLSLVSLHVTVQAEPITGRRCRSVETLRDNCIGLAKGAAN
jgi:hypothetical protein